MISLKDAVSQWLRSVRNEKSPYTLKKYTHDIATFMPYCPERYRELNWQVIETWMEARGERVSKNTVDDGLTSIKSFCRWMCRMYEMPNPAAKVRYRVPPSKRRWKQRILTVDEYRQVVQAAKPNESVIVQWLAHTGLRSCEFRRLAWECFAVDQKAFTILGKGNKERTVPCDSPVCQDLLHECRFRSAPLYTEMIQRPLALVFMCYRIAKRAGIKRFGPHSLRHYFATQMIERGVPVKVVSTILGHSNTAITELVYTHLTNASIMGWSKCLDDPVK